jgi:hypothetical protein
VQIDGPAEIPGCQISKLERKRTKSSRDAKGQLTKNVSAGEQLGKQHSDRELGGERRRSDGVESLSKGRAMEEKRGNPDLVARKKGVAGEHCQEI